MENVNLETLILVFHDDCGGLIIGPIDDLHCAECSQLMEIKAVDRELK